MAKFKVVMIIDGEESEQDEVFDSESEANEYGGYLAGCYHVGAETLHLSNPGDYEEDDADVDWEVIEVDEE